MKRVLFALLVGSKVLFAAEGIVLAQMPSIHVESDEVLVQASVYDRALVTRSNPIGPQKWNWNHGEIRDLSAKDFHLFEDGKEQRIRSVALHRWVNGMLRDNLSQHDEYSNTPRGRWKSTDLGRWSPPAEHYFYVIAYAPPHSLDGSCHQIRVKVDRSGSDVYADAEYCNTKHLSSDPLNGTRFGRRMEAEADSDRSGKIAISLQTGVFYRDSGIARLTSLLSFPGTL